MTNHKLIVSILLYFLFLKKKTRKKANPMLELQHWIRLAFNIYALSSSINPLSSASLYWYLARQKWHSASAPWSSSIIA